MGNEPVESEIPTEYDDLSLDIQAALSIYSKLRDEWDHMNGAYLGKNYVGFMDILELLEVPKEDRRSMFDLVNSIDTNRIKAMKEKAPKK
jgi:hypothetical protein